MKNIRFLYLLLLITISCKSKEDNSIKIMRGKADFNVQTSNPSMSDPYIRTKLYFLDKGIRIIKVNSEKYDWEQDILSKIAFDCRFYEVKDDTLNLITHIVIENEELFLNEASKNDTSSYDLTILYSNLSDYKNYYIMDTTVTVSYKFDFNDRTSGD